ncbi:SusC/RagA family TonB-linked outer membrane protein [Sphingobacterium spiritivorum]|nr:SusC/RagA family TonB-linked outer membrane protein [Sphingobacterium spiritivorum]WQD34773.1 SusC/RagA family TonB-linked outer membrane protein [Sphingobacterium spiritivorum]SUI98374.1 Enterobactin outer-membrane receptor [Sphingobacterium spiritivorum]
MKQFYQTCCTIMLLSIFSITSVFAQQTVTGKVTDASGNVPGVSVSVKGTSRGTQTAADGSYSIQASEGDILRFSMVGYSAQEVTVTTAKTINILLEENQGSLDEVVVTALGIKREAKSLGYSTQKVGGEELTKTNAPNALVGAMGKVSGMNVSLSNGVEGGSQRVVIRGAASLTGANQPLYVVDGMPLDNNPISSRGNDITKANGASQDWGSALNFINPDDIEDITVLKGPTAAALYGARGGNGVVLITTKKGKLKEGFGIDYNYTFRSNDPFRFQEMQNKYGYGGAIALYSKTPTLPTDGNGQLRYPGEAPWTNSGITDQKWLSHGQVPGGKNTYDYFSWYGTGASWGAEMAGQEITWWDGTKRKYSPQPDNVQSFYRTGNTQTHNVAFSGANDLGSIRLSYTKQNNTAIIPNSDFSNNTFNLGSNIKITKKVTADVTTSYINYSRKNSPEVGNSNNSWGKFSTYGMSRDYQNLEKDIYRNADGSKNLLDGSVYPLSYPYGGYGKDIYWNTFMNNSYLNRDQLLGTIKLNAEITDWLSVMGRASGNFSSDEIERKNYPTDKEGVQGTYAHELYKTTERNLDFLATAKKDNLGGSKFSGSIAVGASSWYSNYRGVQAKNDGPFAVPYLFYLKNINKTGNAIDFQPEEERIEQQINSVFTIGNISYDNFLFLEATFRNDWASTLPKDTRSYNYPAASLSYVFTEKWNARPSWLDYGKLRAAFAKSAIGTKPYQTSYIYKTGIFNGQPTRRIAENLLPASTLRPQRSTSYELGTDMSFLQNRLGLTFTYYKVNSTDQIIDLNIAPSSGITGVRTNSGELQNQGIEFTLRGTPVKTKDFSWDLTLNGAHNKNKLVYLAPGIEEYYLDEMFGINGVTMKVKVGDNFGTIYGTDFTYDKETGKRIVEQVLDANGQVAGTRYKVTTDQVAIGNANPKLTGGLGTNLRYKNFSLYALADFKWGGDVWSGSYSTAMGNGQAPETLYERDGNGLAYTYPDGTTANHGVIMDGILVDPNGNRLGENTQVVHYMWKYAGSYAAWSGINMPRSLAVMDNSWVKLREVRLTYQIPKSVVQKTKFFQGLSASVIGRDLFYIYTSLPDKLNPEAINGIGNAQGIEFGALPGVRSFGFSLNASF